MVENAICRIFANGSRRVIIPGLGAFVKRKNGEVIFTDMLRRDDGMLSSSVICIFGISEDKGREIVAHYAAGLKKELAERGSVMVNGIGVLYLRPDGTYYLEQSLADNGEDLSSESVGSGSTKDSVRTGQEAADASDLKTDFPVAASAEADVSLNGEAEEIDESIGYDGQGKAAGGNLEDSAVLPEQICESCGAHAGEAERGDVGEIEGEGAPLVVPRTNRTDKGRLRSVLYGDPDAEREVKTFGDGDLSQKGDCDCSKRGPAEIAGRDADPAAAFIGREGRYEKEAYTPQINIRRPEKPKKRIDGVMITAIIALVITLGILIYGYFIKHNIDRDTVGGVRIELNGSEDTVEAELPVE